MTQVARKLYTPEEYLALEEAAECKSEYFKGEIFAMAGATRNHTRITWNLTGILYNAFSGRSCVGFGSDMRLRVNPSGLYTYPDVSALCGEPVFVEGRNDTITNPALIVEVLSDSTCNYDRGEKFALYRALPTFEDYLLIEQNERLVEYYHRLNSEEWLYRAYTSPEAVINLQSVNVQIPLERIYEGVIFPPLPAQNGHLNPIENQGQ